MGSVHRDQRRNERPPLTEASLEQLAMHYVARYATTAAKLGTYLTRKCRERTTDTPPTAAIERIVAKIVALGYVDDAAYARAKAGSHGRRGYGARRIGASLRNAGVAPDTAHDAIATSDVDALTAITTYLRRRHMGPYATAALTRETRQRTIAALMRAGHSYDDIVIALAQPGLGQEDNE